MKIMSLLIFVLIGFMLNSCVSKKKYTQIKDDYITLENRFHQLQVHLDLQKDSIHQYAVESKAFKEQLGLQKFPNRKDSLNKILMLNLKGAIGNFDEEDINIKMEKGVITINISDKLLFKPGKYEITDKANPVLGKIAKVLMSHPHVEFMVEGHTSAVPFKHGLLLDNWDLSVKRSTSIIRLLQYKYQVPPTKMIAAGRGEYVPRSVNETNASHALNSTTRIIILPN